MRLIDRLASRSTFSGLSFDDVLQMFSFNGNTYYGSASPLRSPQVPIDANFAGFVQGIYNSSGVVAAAVAARALLLSQIRFKWRSTIDGDNGKLFGTQELGVLERPGDLTRPELLHAAEIHDSLAGNAFFYRNGGQVRLLRPDWMTIVFGSNRDPDDPMTQTDAELLGYVYQAGGPSAKAPPEFLDLSQVAHWKPEPDPVCWWRGQSWIGSVLAEIQTDRQATTFKSKFFTNAATPQLIVSLDATATKAQAEEVASVIAKKHESAENAYKSLVLGGGADPHIVGSNLQQLDLRSTQGVDETRIALRSRVPAVVLGISEGMQGSSLNAGNYAQTRRLWSDGWFTPTAQNLCAVMERILTIPNPGTSELSYDPSQVMFLQEDRKDEAEIRQIQSTTMRTLIDGGYDPDTVTAYAATGDPTVLKHSGNVSVQLQPPGAPTPPQ